MLSSPRRSNLISVLIHGAAIALVLIATRVRPHPIGEVIYIPTMTTDISRYLPHTASKRAGGGGGQRDKTPASPGKLPRISLRVFTPPSPVVRNYNPQLTMEPTVMGRPQILAEAPNIPFGVPNGIGTIPSGGRGSGGGLGDGKGPGIGDHNGPGAGDQDGDEVGTGRAHIIGTTVAPVLLTKVDPEYSDEARRAKVQGEVVLTIDVDVSGRPRNIKLVRGLGLGLDEKAMESVAKWKFRAGTVNGKPTVTSATVYVTFRLL